MTRLEHITNDLEKVVLLITFARRSDIEKYLRKYALDLDKKEYRCAICNDRVTSKNIGILIGNGGNVIVICNKSKCMLYANILTLYKKLL